MTVIVGFSDSNFSALFTAFGGERGGEDGGGIRACRRGTGWLGSGRPVRRPATDARRKPRPRPPRRGRRLRPRPGDRRFWVVEVPRPAHPAAHPGARPVAQPDHGLERGGQLRPLRLRRRGPLGAGRRWRSRSSRRCAVWVRAAAAGCRRSAPAAIIGGALGNVWDRLRWGAVADFINMSCCGIRNPFAFNVADAAIFGGAALLRAAPAARARGRDGPGRVR